MAKQAQQDDLVIEITGSIASADATVKAKLKSSTEGTGRIVGYTDDGAGNISVVYVKASTGALATLAVATA